MTTMMMKNPLILVTCTLLLVSLLPTSQSSFGPYQCCFRYIPDKVPKRNVVSYEYTDNRCPKAGVLFTMKRGHEICADPNAEWVQVIVKVIDKVKAKALASVAPQQSD